LEAVKQNVEAIHYLNLRSPYWVQTICTPEPDQADKEIQGLMRAVQNRRSRASTA